MDLSLTTVKLCTDSEWIQDPPNEFQRIIDDFRSPELWLIDENYAGTGIYPPVTVDEIDEPELDKRHVEGIEMKIDHILTYNNISDAHASEICEQIATDLSNTFSFIKKLKPSDRCRYYLPVYGSYENGLCCTESDINFHIDEYFDNVSFRQRIEDEIKVLDYKKAKFSKAELVIADWEYLIKLTHKATKIDAVISFTDRQRFKNAELMKFYLNLNANLKPLILYLKHILIHHNLHGHDKITTNQLFWLVTFVMQREELLPAIRTVRAAATEKQILVINGFTWECTVPPSDCSVSINNNSILQTPASLFIKFVKFYGDFDFLTYFISPYLGCAFPINKIDDVPLDKNTNSPNHGKPVFLKNVINFQDPIILQQNLFGTVRPEVINSFKFLCRCLHRHFTGSIFTFAADYIEINLPAVCPVDFIKSSSITLYIVASPDLKKINRWMTAAIRIIMENFMKFTLINKTPMLEKRTLTKWFTTTYFDYYIDSKNCDKIISWNIVPKSSRNTLMKMYIVCEIYSDGKIQMLMEGAAHLIEFFDKHAFKLLHHILPQVQNIFLS